MAVAVEDSVVEDFAVFFLDYKMLVVVDAPTFNCVRDSELIAVVRLIGKVGFELGGGVGS